MNKYSLTLLAVIFSTASLYSFKSHAEDYYEVVDLGSFVESSYSNAYSINASNQIVGHANGDGFIAHAFIYDYDGGQFNSLGFLEYFIEADESLGIVREEGRSVSFDINDAGLAVGYSLETQTEIINEGEDDETTNITYLSVPVVYDVNNFSVTKIPSFETLVVDRNELENADAIGINNSGLIVGTGLFNEPDDLDVNGNEIDISFDRAFIYDVNSMVLTKINPLDNDLSNHISLRDIDESGYAIGVSAERILTTVVNRKVVGVDVNSPENVVELTIFGTNSQQVSAINNFKKIVGKANDTSESYETAYIHDINTATTIDLGVLNSNSPYSEAFDINDSDQIVGISQTKLQPSTFSGFIYEDGEMKDLNKMIGCDTGWRIHEARSINNNGFITGTGLFNGEARAFMLRPRPGETAPVCDDDSIGSDGSGSASLLGLFSLFALLGLRRRYLK